MYIQCRRRTLPEFKTGAQPSKPRKVTVIKKCDLQKHTNVQCESNPLPIDKPERELEQVPAWLKESLKAINKR